MKAFAVAMTHIKRSPYQAYAAITSMFLTFLVIGLFSLMSIVSFFTLKYFESKPQVTVFFNETAGEKEADALKSTLDATGEIANIKYVSKEDALAIYKEQNKNDPLLLELVTADILPASLEITAKDPRSLGELQPIMNKAEGVEEVVYQKDVIDTLLSWTNAIRLVGGVLGALLAINAILIVMTITALKVALKKEEVEILKLIGASQWYIRMPFLLEGAWYGVFGAGIAWVVITILMVLSQHAMSVFFASIQPIYAIVSSTISPPFIISMLILLITMTFVGALLGAFGSFVALGKYIKF